MQISTFTTMDEAVAKIASGEVQFDVFVPELVYLEQLAVGNVLQPLSLSYIPNLQQNVWPSLHSPWYDGAPLHGSVHELHNGDRLEQHQATGLPPEKYANPWTALWQEGPKIRAVWGCSTTSTTA